MTSFLIVFSFVVGLLLGGFYFGGLWLTIRRLPKSEMAGLWLLASFGLRTAVVLTGFFLVSDGQWARIVSCLAGFLVARIVLIRCLGCSTELLNPEPRDNVGAAGASLSQTEGN